jgi:predicted CXXCH cytochrome family protein
VYTEQLNLPVKNKMKALRNIIKQIQRLQPYSIAAGALVLISVTLLLQACSPKAGSGVLRFFFDGVPSKPVPDTSKQAASDTNRSASAGDHETAGPKIFMHAPYKERACSKCHGGDVPGKSEYGQETSCYSCHANYSEKYSVVHGPVAAGFCTTCHAPHYAENKKLLKKQGQALCLGCHESRLVFQNESHAEIGNKSCTECHNPHGGNDRSMQN